MKNKFRVLIIDDSEEVLRLLKAGLTHEITVDDFVIKIEVATVQINLELVNDGSGNWQITDDTIENLGYVCEEKFDYIFSDFGFIGDKVKAESLRIDLLQNQKREVQESDIKGWLLQLIDIKKKYSEMNVGGRLYDIYRTNINAHFLNHQGKVLVYTTSPPPFANFFYEPQVPVRKAEVQDVFNQFVEPELILIHNEFSITTEIENVFTNSQPRKNFYTNLLLVKIKSLIQYKALEHIVISNPKLRFKVTHSAFKEITAMAIGFGAVVAVFGEALYKFSHDTIYLILKSWGIDLSTGIWINLGITALLIFFSWVVFSKIGVLLSKKIENTAKNLVQNE